MRYLFEDFPTISNLVSARGAFLLLDYDGTLVEMAPTPELATMDETRRGMLRQLSRCPRCQVAIISGRDLNELKTMVGVDNIFYSGSHGLELEGPCVSYRHNVRPEYMATLHKTVNHITGLLRDFKGVIIERKEFSLCVHYRLCKPEQAGIVKHIVTEAITPLATDGDIKVLAGRKNIEILPPSDWNKGSITMLLLEEYGKVHTGDGLLPVFLGDDVTDETAFESLKGKGLTVFVGRHRESSAQYFLRDVGQAYEFLANMAIWLRK
jgi:trehalose 6-phosphate phosphatase